MIGNYTRRSMLTRVGKGQIWGIFFFDLMPAHKLSFDQQFNTVVKVA